MSEHEQAIRAIFWQITALRAERNRIRKRVAELRALIRPVAPATRPAVADRTERRAMGREIDQLGKHVHDIKARIRELDQQAYQILDIPYN